MAKLWIVVGAAFGFVAVAAGAFGAHALKRRLDVDMLEIFDVGSRYALVHAVTLVLVGLLALHVPSRALAFSGGTFAAGIVVFSGSLWLLALTGTKWLGAITPIGGLALLAGWVALAVAGLGIRGGSAG